MCPNVRKLFVSKNSFEISTKTEIGQIKTLTPKMEVNFEIKIDNMDSCRIDGAKTVLWIFGWFGFCIKKSHQEAKFYIYHG